MSSVTWSCHLSSVTPLIPALLQEKEGCGVLELSGGGDSVLSFFMLSHCAGGRLPNMGDTVLSNARLVDGRNKVNNTATTRDLTKERADLPF